LVFGVWFPVLGGGADGYPGPANAISFVFSRTLHPSAPRSFSCPYLTTAGQVNEAIFSLISS